MKLLVDADIFLYQAALAVEEAIDWGDDLWTLHSDVREAKGRLDADLAALGKRFDRSPSDVILCFTDRANWRKAENPDYKSNRKGTRKPIAFAPVRAWCFETKQAVSMPCLEADDVLGILSTEHPGAIIVSADKDLQGIPGTLFNPDKDTFPREITLAAADRWHMLQALMGDRTDGYPGCPGVGPVKAERLLAGLPDDPAALWAAVLEAYLAAGQTEADAIMNARMARICRAGDWNFKTQEMVWLPPSMSA